MKIWVTMMNTETKRCFTRYFESLREKEKYLRKMKYFSSSDDISYVHIGETLNTY